MLRGGEKIDDGKGGWYSSMKCKAVGCRHLAFFAWGFGDVAMFCSEHRQEGMVRGQRYGCLVEGCKQRPYIGWVSERGSYLYCVTRKRRGMVNLTDSWCYVRGCEEKAVGGAHGGCGGKKMFCVRHSGFGKTKSCGVVCRVRGCFSYAYKGWRGDEVGTFCRKHAKGWMVECGGEEVLERWGWKAGEVVMSWGRLVVMVGDAWEFVWGDWSEELVCVVCVGVRGDYEAGDGTDCLTDEERAAWFRAVIDWYRGAELEGMVGLKVERLFFDGFVRGGRLIDHLERWSGRLLIAEGRGTG